jgi:hypothetical protein
MYGDDIRKKTISYDELSHVACLSMTLWRRKPKKTSNDHKLMKPERFLCGCAVEWDGKKVTFNICEFHQNETKKLKVE